MATREEMVLAVDAVKQGLLESEQVQECLDIQRHYQEQGKSYSLLKILVAKNYLTRDQARALAKPAKPRTVTFDQASEIPGYTILEKAGEGGVATVFRAREDALNRDVAIKILFPAHAVNPVFVERFKQEGQLLIQFDHPNLVKGYRVGVHQSSVGPLHYMTMYFVDGMSVQEDLNQHGPLDEGKALHIILQIAEALEYLQGQNAVHRDIKPDNILYDPDGTIQLCDLGFAREVVSSEDEALEDVTCGTVQYISPEQARGLANVDIRADIYSLGATLYHLVVGEVPFQGEDAMDIMSKQVLEDLTHDAFRKRKLSQWFSYFIEKMMSKDREIRYQTPRELIEDVQTILAGAQDLIYRPDDDPVVNRFGAGGRVRGSGRMPRRVGSSTRRRLAPPPDAKPQQKPSSDKISLWRRRRMR